MRALVSSTTSPHAELADAPDPHPDRNQALVEVKAFSLNRGETKRLASMEPGSVTGWDVAGIVREAAADGSGPPQGARVVGLVRLGAWAELAAVNTDVLAELPDEVSLEQAATLPVAGLTALRALEVGGFVLGKRVLVTGASGGVGRFAIQLATLAGAHVTGLARRTAGLSELGADEVIQVLEPDGPTYDVIIDAVGGATLGAAIGRVAPSGTIINFAATSDEPVSYPTRTLFGRAPGASVIFLLTGSPDRVSALSRPGTRPGIRPVIRDGHLEGTAILSRFPVAFPLPAFRFFGHPIPAVELGPPHGRLTDRALRRDRTPTGLPCSARSSCDRGGCPLYPEDDGAHPGRTPFGGRRLPRSHRPVLAPRSSIPSARPR